MSGKVIHCEKHTVYGSGKDRLNPYIKAGNEYIADMANLSSRSVGALTPSFVEQRTDMEKLKTVFDNIGIDYYHEQNENKVCLHVNNGCFDCCGVVFNFKDYKFTDATPRT
jgi:hypothetical protein